MDLTVYRVFVWTYAVKRYSIHDCRNIKVMQIVRELIITDTLLRIANRMVVSESVGFLQTAYMLVEIILRIANRMVVSESVGFLQTAYMLVEIILRIANVLP